MAGHRDPRLDITYWSREEPFGWKYRCRKYRQSPPDEKADERNRDMCEIQKQGGLDVTVSKKEKKITAKYKDKKARSDPENVHAFVMEGRYLLSSTYITC